MIAEFDFGGVYIGAAAITACCSGVLLIPAKRLLLRWDVYRFFWHPRLVDLALFAVLWAVIAFCVASFLRRF